MTCAITPANSPTFARQTRLAGLEPKRFLPLLITQSSLSATGVLEVLLAKLGERARFKRSTNLLLLEKHLADLEPVTLMLVLDDAQNYPAPALEELRLLLGLGGRHRSAFALVLLGDDYLLGSLRLRVQRALFSRISASVVLPPLLRDDIAAYLNWHVSRAGLDRDIFAPAAVDLLAEASEGNPPALSDSWLKPPGLPPPGKPSSPSKPTTSTPHCAKCPPPARKSTNPEPHSGLRPRHPGPPAEPASSPTTPAHKSKNPAPIAKKHPSSPPFMSPKSPVLIVTGHRNITDVPPAHIFHP